MGYEEYPTRGTLNAAVIHNAQEEGKLLRSGFEAFAVLNGYSITLPDLSSGHIEKAIAEIKKGCIISKEGKSITMTLEEFSRVLNKICDHVDIELQYLFNEKGV